MATYKEEFPLVLAKTKKDGQVNKFNLADPEERKLYFNEKVGEEITKLREYFENHTFVAYWLGKKNAGKGTYSKLMMEIFGNDKIAHISVGDVVRDTHKALETAAGREELAAYLKKDYRGYISIEEGIKAILNRSQDKVSVPNELMLSLVKREIDKQAGKIIFIDGFPRTLDQISYSLYFRALINYREDPDIFITIDIPVSVIDERMKYRVVCPKCQTPRNLKLFATREVGYDRGKEKFYLICDNPDCQNERMGAKEGDNLGIESIRARLEMDQQLIDRVFSLHGVPKILLRNSIPVAEAKNLVDDYEITPEYVYELEDDQKVKIIEKPWVIKDDEGHDAYSLLAPPVVVSLIKQLAKILLG